MGQATPFRAKNQVPADVPCRSVESLHAEACYNTGVAVLGSCPEDALWAMVNDHVARYPQGISPKHPRK